MTTLQYKLFETVAKIMGLHKSIQKGLAKGESLSDAPPKKLADRWAKTQFQGRDIWTCGPKTNATGKVYVHQHGGAYVLGLNALHFETLTKIADMSGVTIVLPDYPLPPAASADEIVGFARAHFADVVEGHGLNNTRLGGDSAGANLALAVCELGTELHGDCLLLSPWVDLDMSEMSDEIPNRELLLEPISLRRAGHRYAGDHDPKTPWISPIFSDFKNLPDMRIFTGELDLLHADIMTFAARAKSADKLSKLAVYGEYGHYWMFYPTPDRDSFLIEIAAALRE